MWVKSVNGRFESVNGRFWEVNGKEKFDTSTALSAKVWSWDGISKLNIDGIKSFFFANVIPRNLFLPFFSNPSADG